MSSGIVLLVLAAAGCGSPQARIQRDLNRKTGVVYLPSGVLEIHSELQIPAGAHDLEIAGGSGTVLRAADDFQGRAMISGSGAERVRLHGFSIDGNRTFRESQEMAPPENAFRLMYRKNGLWFDRTRDIRISDVKLMNVTSFAILISRSSDILIDGVSVAASGSLNRLFRNNGTGGIVIEEAASQFTVRRCTFRHILGNALWTHSLYTSQRNRDGVFEQNEFDTVGRDAIQVGHATGVRVVDNRGHNIGYPVDIIDRENEGTPVAIDTAGNVGDTVYTGNRFDEVNGKCFDLDGFHDGQVRGNSCVNRGTARDYEFGHFALVMNDSNPDMHSRNVTIADNEFNGVKFGGIYVVGGPHRIEGNRLLNLNLAHCNDNPAINCLYLKDQPDLLRSGIYLAAGVKRPDATAGNIIERNRIEGYRIREHCIVASPAVRLAANTVADNQCRDAP
ncbi:MAG TPA: right-handed parallel beta-helix repeat-containing protein [Bryobacteraceae bacterium]|nr:right-handed parallel beta-helix repeat-containing protein [Bryobacteraceae bacterium]